MKKPSEQLFHKYEYLVYSYSAKLYNLNFISYEIEDVNQELRIKLYHSIIAYGRRWNEYLEGKKTPPVKIKYYLKAALGNHINDLITKITREGKHQVTSTSSGDTGLSFDVGEYNPNRSEINLDRNKAVINDIDLFAGLTCPIERGIFSLYLRGKKLKDIRKIKFGKRISVTNVINKQIRYLSKHKDSLMQENKNSYFVKNYSDES